MYTSYIVRTILLFSLFATSCAHTKDPRGSTPVALPLSVQNDVARPADAHTIPFTLDFPDLECLPVALVHVSGTHGASADLFLLCDTGFQHNVLTKRGVEKLYGRWETYKRKVLFSAYLRNKKILEDTLSLYQKRRFYHQYCREFDSLTIKHRTDVALFFLAPNEDGLFLDGLDGVLGQDFFQSYKTVTFDYIQKVLLLDAARIVESGIPLTKDFRNRLLVPCHIDSSDEMGMIDTGCDALVLRDDIGKSDFVLTDEDIAFIETGDTPPARAAERPIVSVYLATFFYEAVRARHSFDARVVASDWSRRYTSKVSLLGYPFFKDHIIQLDFDNNEFLMK